MILVLFFSARCFLFSMAASELLLGCLLNVSAAHIQLLNKTFSAELITIPIYTAYPQQDMEILW